MKLFDENRIYNFIHVEMSNKCNLECPMCPRVELLEKNFWTNKEDLSYNKFVKIFDPILNNCGKFFLSGNYSDPMTNKDIEKITDFILKGKNSKITIGSNGSLRSEKVWNNLGKKFKKHWEETKRPSTVLFAIDGLEDTNHIYRINANWNKLMNNAKAFIDGGGFAEWKFVLFEHNQHQVDEAEELSKKLGFKRFVKVISDRFADDEGNLSNEKLSIKRSKGEYDLEDFVKESDEILCEAIDNNGIFVTEKGLVMPCCWTGNDFGYNIEINNLKDRGINHLISKYPDWKTNLNALNNNIIEVLKNPFWEDLESLWKLDSPKTCNRQCKKNLRHGIKIEKRFTN